MSVTGSNVIDKKKYKQPHKQKKKLKVYSWDLVIIIAMRTCFYNVTHSVSVRKDTAEKRQKKKKGKKLNHIYRDTFLEYEQPKQEETI